MAFDFKNKVAVVTGAGQGIGFQICHDLVASGATVILNDIDEQLAQSAANRISESAGARCIAKVGDVGDSIFIEKMVNEIFQEFGAVDVAIANAGITLFGSFLSYSAEDFQKVLQVNLGGSFFLAQAATNCMKKQESGGSILFMSSVTGHQAHKDLGVYGMTKAAVEMLARNLVIEISQYGINVNAIAPGATLTERTLGDSQYADTWKRITPMGRPATVQDISSAALFLVSTEARHITGQALVIDGGWTCVSPSPF